MFSLNTSAIRTLQSALGTTARLGKPAATLSASVTPRQLPKPALRNAAFRIEWLCAKK